MKTIKARNSEFAKEFINDIEGTRNLEGTESFFETEEKLLNHLYKLEKKEAKQTARKMIEYISAFGEGEAYKSVKYYLITFSSIVVRYLGHNHLAPSKAVAFNVTCITLIEQKLTVGNANDIADELVELFTYVLAEEKQPTFQHNTVNEVIRYINKEVESPMTVEGIAKLFDVSTSHLSRIFREHLGITLVEYINIRKVEEAQYYLRFSRKKIAEIAIQFNFCNQSYFTRIFKKYTGETPRRFRQSISIEYFQFNLPDESKPTGEE